MNKEFPCKVCTHPAYHHYVNVTKDSFICTGCLETEKDRNVYFGNESRHEFIGDNFKYLELIEKREELKNEN